MTLPIGSYEFYVGIDPGNKGAIGLMNKTGTLVQSSTMPMTPDGEADVPALRDIFRHLARFPLVAVGIEWPTAWPQSFGNVPGNAVKFGQHMGRLEAMAVCHGLEYFKVPPQLWKGRLGWDGKTIEGANERAAALWGTFYPEHVEVVHGPRGGIWDGPREALLIVHMLRTRIKM